MDSGLRCADLCRGLADGCCQGLIKLLQGDLVLGALAKSSQGKIVCLGQEFRVYGFRDQVPTPWLASCSPNPAETSANNGHRASPETRVEAINKE